MTIYKGGIGQWSWMLHRITGVGVLIFLLTHIIDTALIMLGPDLYNKIIGIYRLPLFGLMEIGLFGAVLYHALNGVRVILVDFWVASIAIHEKMFWIQMVIFALIYVPVTIVMIGHILHAGAHP